MHHRRRYKNKINLHVLFYGENITEEEKQTAQKLVVANSVNLACNVSKISFVQSTVEMKGII
jgi:hypothetical protein